MLRTLRFSTIRRMSSATKKTLNQDIIAQVIDDHNTVKSLWSKFQTENNKEEKDKLANQIIYEVSVHSHAEELVLYPAIEKSLQNKGKQLVDESRAEHAEVKKKLYAVDRMKAGDPNLDSQLNDTLTTLEQHIKEEETDILPQFKSATDVSTLQELGKKFERIKAAVPTRPHPSAPDKPLMETLIGLAVAPADNLRDATRSFSTGEEK